MLTCDTCGRRIEDLAEVERVYGEVHEDQGERYKHFKADDTDPSGYRGFYYPMDHPAAPAVAHSA
jgi:hypothetical protein